MKDAPEQIALASFDWSLLFDNDYVSKKDIKYIRMDIHKAKLAERDAEIARLRLEYEPDQMTAKELNEWEQNQVGAKK